MAAMKKGQALDMDFFSLLDHVEEQKETLWTTWKANGRQDFESAIRIVIQDVESYKNRYPELNVSASYLLGKLDGYTELFEQLYREEQRVYKVAEALPPKAHQILLYLNEHDGTRHGELAAAIGSSYSSLTNIMKKVLFSGAVEAVRSGRNTCYHLTETGRHYCDRCLHNEGDDLTHTIRRVVRETVRVMLDEVREANSLPAYQLREGDTFTPVIDSEIRRPLVLNRISNIDNQKYAVCSSIEDAGIKYPALFASGSSARL